MTCKITLSASATLVITEFRDVINLCFAHQLNATMLELENAGLVKRDMSRGVFIGWDITEAGKTWKP